MKKTFLITLGGIMALVILGIITSGFTKFDLISKKSITTKKDAAEISNLVVKIKDEVFILENGKAEKDIAPGSAIKNKIMIFGEPVYGDLDEDGDKDAAILLVNSSGGTGSFYYAVLGINNGKQGYKASNTIFLGDRIAPQTIEIHDGRALFNYAVRKESEPMSARPSIGKSFWVNFDKNTGEISELVKN
jgi:hypothetical protein